MHLVGHTESISEWEAHVLKKKFWLILIPLVMLGINYPGNTVLPAAGEAEIPANIWAAMDASTKQELTEEPKYVALTFDDGPRRGTTDLLLNGLMERGVSATFFVVGEQVSGNEDLILRMSDEGHQVGNHTYSHVRLLTAEKNIVIEEIRKGEVVLENLLGEQEFWLRPPYGLIDKSRASLVKTPMIYWSVDTEDWKLLDAQQIVQCVEKAIQSGDIVLLHDFYPTSVDAALELIDCLQTKGFTFVTVEELFRIKGVTPEAGTLYAAPEELRPLT